ncbi:dysbindin domain-containing protein 1 isoform X2 [Astyanax mexicanus]|uniref:dysbindin domain-containing protein 1 isoform X2 n=1 Tax=Astyanax mexicanus TaxID=7994 RepID=UPI000440C5F5|nr:dysbindin domain-containing protein 1 isoform X2 [Astyanax mexicanus]
MEAQGGASSPDPNKDIQKLLKPSSSGELPKEPLHHPTEPLSSVSSLEVHFDLLDLTELTDMSDQELAEVFADSDEENHNDSPASHHHHPLPLHRSGYMRSPSWTRCSKNEQTRDRKHHSDSDTTDPHRKLERPKQP